MKFSVLGSSSAGNCSYLEVNNKRYLLDCGFSLRQTVLKLREIGIELDSLDGIFITHEHHDHFNGLSSILNRFRAKVYMSKNAYRNLPEGEKKRISPVVFSFFRSEEEFEVNGMKVLPFRTSHDAADPVGFRFSFEDKTLVYLTDTGCFSFRDELKNADAYILESNHEPDMLLMSARPWVLKNRILSNSGHLSNLDSAELFSGLMGPKTKNLVLFHLSNECNTKELAVMAYESLFKRKNISLDGINIVPADRANPLPLIEV